MGEQARASFDRVAFLAALDATRVANGQTWREVGRETGVSASTFTRLVQGHAPDVNNLAILADWAGIGADRFIVRTAHGRRLPTPMVVLATCLYTDPSLSPEAARCLSAMLLTAYDSLRTSRRLANDDHSDPSPRHGDRSSVGPHLLDDPVSLTVADSVSDSFDGVRDSGPRRRVEGHRGEVVQGHGDGHDGQAATNDGWVRPE